MGNCDRCIIGIGLELANCLASVSLNLVLCSKSLEKLEEVEGDLKTRFKIQTKVVAVNLAQEQGINEIFNATKNLNVGLLVASAGYGRSGSFTNSSLDAEINMLRVNCEALLSLTHHYSRRFAEQKRGGIILMSSMVAFPGVPYAANYAATKAYVQSLAEALSVELKPYGVDVLAAAPGPVKSVFEQRANMKMSMFLTPSQIAILILKALGKKTNVLPGLLTKILVYSLRTVPRWGKVRIMEKVMGGMTEHQRK